MKYAKWDIRACAGRLLSAGGIGGIPLQTFRNVCYWTHSIDYRTEVSMSYSFVIQVTGAKQHYILNIYREIFQATGRSRANAVFRTDQHIAWLFSKTSFDSVDHQFDFTLWYRTLIVFQSGAYAGFFPRGGGGGGVKHFEIATTQPTAE